MHHCFRMKLISTLSLLQLLQNDNWGLQSLVQDEAVLTTISTADLIPSKKHSTNTFIALWFHWFIIWFHSYWMKLHGYYVSILYLHFSAFKPSWKIKKRFCKTIDLLSLLWSETVIIWLLYYINLYFINCNCEWKKTLEFFAPFSDAALSELK